MNKFTIGVIIIVLLLIGGGTYYLSQRSPKQEEVMSENAMVEEKIEQSTGEKMTGTFMDLLRLGQNYNCTFSSSDEEGNKTEGKIYVAAGGDKLNGSFTLTQKDNTSYNSYIIRDGEYNYIWSSVMKQGYKTKIEPEDETLFGDSSTDNKESNVGLTDKDKVDFNCRPWIVNNSLFSPPTDIEFINLAEQMQEMKEKMNESVETGCSACDQLPAGSAKDQCLSTLGC